MMFSTLLNNFPKSPQTRKLTTESRPDTFTLSNYRSNHFNDFQHYKDLYSFSISQPDIFWGKMAMEHIDWFTPFKEVTSGSLEKGNVTWFTNGTLNVAYNCIDRHIKLKENQKAIIWESDDPKIHSSLTYGELLAEVCRVSNSLKELGVGKGDRVAIYMPMIPEALISMLACARIGAVHTVIFGGFSSHSLSNRINNSKAKILITANEGLRGGKIVPLKQIADEALVDCPTIAHVLVFKRTNHKPDWTHHRDIWWHDIVNKQKPYCPPEPIPSEHPLFLLYTSGSTGKPKGMEHTSAGYLLYTSLTFKYIFDHHPGDVHACMADIGWVTGHSYIVYGPLSNGATTFMFESVPTYPTPSRYWDIIDKYKITQLYTAPTAIRALMAHGLDHLKNFKGDSLRVLGTVGEPINPAAWKWYFENVGKSRCPIVDTYWQTETGGIIISPIPGVTNELKPGAAMLPFLGIQTEVLNEKGVPQTGDNVTGVLAIKSKWPGIARSVFGDHERYMETYLRPYPHYYFTGDGCVRDDDGHIWITGRVDDVINKAGHRIGSAEIESALVANPACAEAAVVTVPDDIMGEKIIAYCTLKEGFEESDLLINELKQSVASDIGKFAVPDRIILTSLLPKTRSGKIMRRILRKIVLGQTSPEEIGDVSTLSDPDSINKLIHKVYPNRSAL